MKILVTGGTGFVGSHSAVALARAGHELRLLVRSPEKAKRVFEDLETDLPPCVRGDVTDVGSVVAALDGCDGVLHAAALVAMDPRSAVAVERTNLAGTKNVVGQAAERGVEKIVYVSSVSALFDPDGGTIGPDSEPTALAGSVYSESKARTDRWVRDLQDRRAPIASTYPGGVLGPFAPILTDLHRSLPLQLRALLATEGGMNLVDVRDLAAIHVALFARPSEPSRWLAGGPFVSWLDLADLLEDITGRHIRRLGISGRVLRALGRAGDVVGRVIHFQFPLSYEGMATATRWPGVDSSKTLVDLDVSFRELRETLIDTLRWMHGAGHVKRDHVGRLAGSGDAS